jgi:hypothetical protein
MEIQRIEEIIDAEDVKVTVPSRAVPTTAENSTDNITEADFDEEIPTDLIPTSPAEDGPEVFKRIRYISRWEYRSESRGELRHKIDQHCWWSATCIEARAIRIAVSGDLNRAWCKDGSFDDRSWETSVYIRFFFVGPSVQQSRPVLVLFSMSKRRREKVWKYLKQIDWIKAHPYLIVLTTSHSAFHDGIKAAWDTWHKRQIAKKLSIKVLASG